MPYVTPEQYLEYDRNSEIRNEYIYGEIIPMEEGTPWHGPTGTQAETPWHSLIVANVIRHLGNSLSGGPCRVYAAGPRTSLDPKKGYFYPDITVVCGPTEYLDSKKDTVTNPRIAVEVLSPSTMNHDLGPKARLYWKVPSLTDLIFIEQARIWIEHWHRSSDGEWDHTLIEDPAGIFKIASANIEIPMTEIYAGVELPPPGE